MPRHRERQAKRESAKPFAALGRRGSKSTTQRLEYMTKADRDRRLNNDGGEPLRAKLNLSIANCEPLQDRESLKYTIEAKNSHHNGMPLRLRPSGRIYGQDQDFAFRHHSDRDVEELHPRWQGGCMREQKGVKHRRCAEGYWKPQRGAADDEQSGTWREMPADSKYPCHAAFESLMESRLERAVADVFSDLRPLPGDDFS